MADHTFQNNGDHSSTGALPPWWTTDTVAVVTGANRGIGYEIVRKLAVEGMTVVLTARDEGRGLKATGDLHAANLKNVVFHKLDVANPDSVTEFAKWLKETYDGLDILINNAASGLQSHAYDRALECLNINYFGAMHLIENLLPLFKESVGRARIINMSSLAGILNNYGYEHDEITVLWKQFNLDHQQIKNVNNKKLRKQLSDPHTFNQAFLNTIAERYLSACQSHSEDVHQFGISCYFVSKVLLNAYTRLLAQAYPTFFINCVHPGLVETEMLRGYIEHVTPEGFQEQLEKGFLGKDAKMEGVGEGVDTAVWLALQRPLPGEKAASGLFWYKRAVHSFHSRD